jgi:hypothetical protein
MSFSLLAFASFSVRLRIRPKSMPGEMDENVFERRFAERD